MTPGALWALVRRPDLWVTGLRQYRRLVPAGWWRRRPWLPVPDRQYLEFRLLTQYGSSSTRPEPGDVVTYLEWCRAQRRGSGHAPRP